MIINDHQHVTIEGDTFHCSDCGCAWDMRDSEPPGCNTQGYREIHRNTRDDKRARSLKHLAQIQQQLKAGSK